LGDRQPLLGLGDRHADAARPGPPAPPPIGRGIAAAPTAVTDPRPGEWKPLPDHKKSPILRTAQAPLKHLQPAPCRRPSRDTPRSSPEHRPAGCLAFHRVQQKFNSYEPNNLRASDLTCTEYSITNSPALRGQPADPLHRVENREWCSDRTTMSKRNNENHKANLALAMAAGTAVPDWARENDVHRRTAYTWSRSPEVLDQVKLIRSQVLDRAAGRLSDNATAAADKIAKLAQEAASESVQLQAARAVLAELMTVSNYLAIERRLDELERRVAHAQPQ
jgi:hypothetical protein